MRAGSPARIEAAVEIGDAQLGGTAIVGPEPGGEAAGGQRARQVVALREVAAELAQGVERLRVLDALGHDAQAERVGELDRRGDDRPLATCASRARRSGRS